MVSPACHLVATELEQAQDQAKIRFGGAHALRTPLYSGVRNQGRREMRFLGTHFCSLAALVLLFMHVWILLSTGHLHGYWSFLGHGGIVQPLTLPMDLFG